MEYGSDYFDKELNPESKEDRLSEDSTPDCDYADKTKEASASGEDRYDEIFDTTKRNTRAFSVISLVLGAVSVLCSFVGPLGFIFGLAAVASALVSRRLLGFFDGICIAGLIVGIFGSAFGLVIFLLSIFTDIFDAIKNLF